MKIKINNIELQVENDMTFWNNISEWEKYSFEIIDKFINGNTFVDIGAWNGVLSMYASFKAKEVHSFEPDKIAFKNLENNIKLNSINNIKINNAGASNINGASSPLEESNEFRTAPPTNKALILAFCPSVNRFMQASFVKSM